MSKYVPTGYPTGRPRRGEVRPLTAKMKALRAWRAANREHVLEQNREHQRKWRANNPERYAEIQRNVRLRKKQWDEAKEYRGLPEVYVVSAELIALKF